MNLFQAIGIPVAILLLLITLISTFRRRVTAQIGLSWSAVWLLAAVAMARPSLTSEVATKLGIGRGADLILYCSIIAMMIGFFVMYIRYRKVEDEITILVRHIASMEARAEPKAVPRPAERGEE